MEGDAVEKGGCETTQTSSAPSRDTATSPERRLSYQKDQGDSNGLRRSSSSSHHSSHSSSRSSDGRRRSSIVGVFRGIVASTFRRFSIEGYESPPDQDDDDFADETDSEDDDQRRRRKIIKQKSSLSLCTLICCTLVLVVILACAFWAYTTSKEGRPYIYTGDTSVFDSKNEAAMQSLKSFSTLQDIEHGAVAADHPKCSEIGLSILRDHHGNAVDAAVATALCLGVANPSSSGIGGGAFILVHSEAGQKEDMNKLPKFHDARTNGKSTLNQEGNKITEVIDCREVAGEAASTDMFEADGVPEYASLFGGLAVAVPGELRGLELAHARHGRLDWATVVRPAMELALDGVPVYEHLASDIKHFQSRQQALGGLPTLRPLLTHDNNWDHILREGDLMKNPKLAETLQAIMDQGADALYTGHRAEQLANEIQQAGGILTKKDFENFFPTLRSPVVSDTVFGTQIVGVPPPSSGGAVIIGALRFLAGYAEPLASYADTLSVHRIVEAMKHVFAIRMSMGDPAFPLGNDVTNATTQDAVDALIQGSYMEDLRRRVSSDDSILNLSHYGGLKFAQLNDTDGQTRVTDAKEGDRRRLLRSFQRRRHLLDHFGYLEDRGTSHVSVVDNDLNAVAITTSVNTQFGSCIVSESTGVLLGNTMNDFANPGLGVNMFGLHPSEANFIKPGKKRFRVHCEQYTQW